MQCTGFYARKALTFLVARSLQILSNHYATQWVDDFSVFIEQHFQVYLWHIGCFSSIRISVRRCLNAVQKRFVINGNMIEWLMRSDHALIPSWRIHFISTWWSTKVSHFQLIN